MIEVVEGDKKASINNVDKKTVFVELKKESGVQYFRADEKDLSLLGAAIKLFFKAKNVE